MNIKSTTKTGLIVLGISAVLMLSGFHNVPKELINDLAGQLIELITQVGIVAGTLQTLWGYRKAKAKGWKFGDVDGEHHTKPPA